MMVKIFQPKEEEVVVSECAQKDDILKNIHLQNTIESKKRVITFLAITPVPLSRWKKLLSLPWGDGESLQKIQSMPLGSVTKLKYSISLNNR